MASALAVAAQRGACGYRYTDLFYETAAPKFNAQPKRPAPSSPVINGTGKKIRNEGEKRNLQPHRAKLGPKPQKKAIPNHPQRSSLSLYEAIQKDLEDKQPLTKIRGKIYFALTIPSTPPALARDLYQIAIKYHIENDKIINGFSDVQDLDAVLEVFQYLKRIQKKPMVVQYGFILKCWIGPKIMDMDQLDKNFEQIKPLVPVERLEQIYAIYLSVYAHQKDYKKVDSIMERMRKEDVKLTHFTYTEVLSALIQHNASEGKINQIMLNMDKDNFDAKDIVPTRLMCSNILNFYIKTGQIEKALNTAEAMENHGVPFYDDSFLPLIDGFRKAGILSGVLYILNEMVSRKITLSKSVYTSVIAAYCELHDTETAMKVFETMKAGGTTPFAPTYNCLINGYLKADDVQGAVSILALMKKDNVPPDLETYPHFIDYFRKKSDLDNALESMQQMRNEKLPINHITYYTVISLAIRLQQAKGLINKMLEEKVTPNDYLYRAMLLEMCKRGIGDLKLFEIFDLMDSLNATYNPHQLTPVLKAMLNPVHMRADIAWEVLRRAMLRMFDLKTLPKDVKKDLKRLGLMHPIENGAVE